MAGSPKKRSLKIELEADAWPRFERFIKEVAKAGPQHRTSQKTRKKEVLDKSGKTKEKSQNE